VEAAKEKTHGAGVGCGLLETCNRGPRVSATTGTAGWSWISSTTRKGCGYRCGGSASARLDQRYYDTNSGSFWSPDPSLNNIAPWNTGTWNKYAYGNGDPINFNDPTGLGFWSSIWGGIKSVFGGQSQSVSSGGAGGAGSKADAMVDLGAGDEDPDAGGVPCIYSIMYFGARPPDLLSAGAACSLSAVYTGTNTPVTLLGFGSIIIPGVLTGAGELAGVKPGETGNREKPDGGKPGTDGMFPIRVIPHRKSIAADRPELPLTGARLSPEPAGDAESVPCRPRNRANRAAVPYACSAGSPPDPPPSRHG
jgi:RHS repeat-associated protein